MSRFHGQAIGLKMMKALQTWFKKMSFMVIEGKLKIFLLFVSFFAEMKL